MATIKYVQYKKLALDLIRAGLSDIQVKDKIRMDKNVDIPDWRIKQWRNLPKKKGVVDREDGLTPAKVIQYLQSVAMFFYHITILKKLKLLLMLLVYWKRRKEFNNVPSVA